MRRRENVLLLGPPGVGTTHLAMGLGIRAIQASFSALFVPADELIEQLRRDGAAGNRRLKRRKALTVSVLIIDELGFQALDRKEAHLLFRVVAHRYERASTIITSNVAIRDWPRMLAGDEVPATAILDRLLHHCHVVQIDGSSSRLRDLERRLAGGRAGTMTMTRLVRGRAAPSGTASRSHRREVIPMSPPPGHRTSPGIHAGIWMSPDSCRVDPGAFGR